MLGIKISVADGDMEWGQAGMLAILSKERELFKSLMTHNYHNYACYYDLLTIVSN